MPLGVERQFSDCAKKANRGQARIDLWWQWQFRAAANPTKGKSAPNSVAISSESGGLGSAPWTRTTISRFKVSRPAIGRAPN